MNSELAKILNQTEWTGEDLGRVFFFALVDKFSGKEFPITQEDMDNKIASLEGRPYENLLYYYMVSLASFVEIQRSFLESSIKEFKCAYSNLMDYLKDLDTASYHVQKMNRLPLVITREKFESYKNKALELLGAEPLSISDLMIKSLEIAIKEKIKTQEQAPALADALNHVQAQECANNRFLELYKRVYKHGSYFLKDGSRYEFDVVHDNDTRGKLLFKGVYTLRKIAKDYDLTDYSDQDLIDALDLNPITKEIEYIIDDIVTKEFQDVTWIENKDLIINVNDLLMLYVDGYKKNKVRAISYLKADFAELYQALLTHVCNAIGAPGDDLFTKITNKKEVVKTQIVGADLYMRMSEAGVFYVLNEHNTSDDIYHTTYYDMLKRASSGVIYASLEQENSFNECFNNASLLPQLTGILNNCEWGIIKNTAYKDINASLRALQTYRALLKVIESQFKINNLYKYGKHDITEILSCIDSFNSFLYRVYFSIGGSAEQRNYIRAIIKDSFKELDFNDFEIKRSVINKAIKQHRDAIKSTNWIRQRQRNFYEILEV